MVTACNSLEAAKQELTKAARLRDLVNLVSPEDAIVTRVPQLSVGGVAGGAQPLFGLVPLNATLQVAVQIEPQDIGFVKVGDPVNLKFDAYKYLEHGLGHGVVSTFSQDSFADGSGGLAIGSGNGTTDSRAGAHFDARVKITGVDLHELPDGAPRLVPGMTVQADIVVGRRTILWYLLGGALRSGSEAMREP
jgi:multidrug efflux pump subunit AcrA (membrane-fusion protein)